MRSDSHYPGGKFIIIGNPLDIQLISNINWVFNSSSQDEVSGVEVTYSVGHYSGANYYQVLSSDYVPQGQLRIVFYPSQPDQMTYKYYPYTFNIENTQSGYRDPNNQNVPAIVMAKRHTFEEFKPLQAVVAITNNLGALPTGQWNGLPKA